MRSVGTPPTVARPILAITLGCALSLFLPGAAGSAERPAKRVQESVPAPPGIQVTVLYDNNSYDERLQTAWGFACLVQGLEKTILFDTGGHSEILLSNMRRLGIEPGQVDVVVISHIHWDHRGGLQGFLAQNNAVTVYLPSSLPQDTRRAVEERGAELVVVDGPVQLCPCAYSTGELGRWIKEQSLMVETPGGLVLITGCAHPGIVNIVREARSQSESDVHLALGGFHLSMASPRRIQHVIRALRAEGVERVAPLHCSGEVARRLFEESYGRQCILAGVGWSLRVPPRPEVAVYVGTGAARAKDVTAALKRIGMPCRGLDERAIRGSALDQFSVLIIPGGRTARMVRALGQEGLERIREFVADGGGYVGICAGAYMAATTVEVPGNPEGLGIVDIRNHRRAGKELRSLELRASQHPVVAGCPETMQIWYENGPAIEPGENSELLAAYGDGTGAVVSGRFGRGRVVIFSPHPEGSLEAGIDPAETGTLALLRGAVAFASGREE